MEVVDQRLIRLVEVQLLGDRIVLLAALVAARAEARVDLDGGHVARVDGEDGYALARSRCERPRET